ncbi:hypothetical protein LD669_18145 [Salmonella enterica]|nr:hypothetical protein [Salmonella enterica]MDJ7090084.1 hypothetical protein [Salmonella enterica]
MSKVSKVSSICFLFSLPFFSFYANAGVAPSVQNVISDSVDVNFTNPGPTISMTLKALPDLQTGPLPVGAVVAKANVIATAPVTFAFRFHNAVDDPLIGDVKGSTPSANPLHFTISKFFEFDKHLIGGKQWGILRGPATDSLDFDIQSFTNQTASAATYTTPVDMGVFVQ